MTRQEKKEFLEDFIEQLWMLDINLVKEEQSDYDDGKINVHHQTDEQVSALIEWYLNGISLR